MGKYLGNLILIWAVFASGLFANEPVKESLKIGDVAPTFYLKDLENNDVFLRNYCGEKLRKPWKNKEKYVVVLSFWATWCGPCQKEIPVLQEVYNSYEGQNLKVYLVDVGEKKELVAPFVKEKKYELPVLLDIYSMVSAKKYMVSSLPRLFVIDQNGVIQHITKGFKGEEHLRKELKSVLDRLLGQAG